MTIEILLAFSIGSLLGGGAAIWWFNHWFWTHIENNLSITDQREIGKLIVKAFKE